MGKEKQEKPTINKRIFKTGGVLQEGFTALEKANKATFLNTAVAPGNPPNVNVLKK